MGISVNSNWYNFFDIFNYKAELFHGKFPKQRGYSGGPYLHYKSVLLKKQFLESALDFLLNMPYSMEVMTLIMKKSQPRGKII